VRANGEDLLTITGLTVALPEGADRAHAVENIDLAIASNEIVCMVGESGSGKSVTSHAILGLLPVPYVRPIAGSILFQGEDLLKLSDERLRAIRGNRIAMIFQEPMTALNPVLTIGDQIAEAIRVHRPLPQHAMRQRLIELLAAVNLPDPAQLVDVFPFRLSGGQRQRVMIAMALALEPDLLIADEPTTALDVTTQAQILRLIRDLQAQKRMGVLFVTHDFGVVAEIATRVAVMEKGRLVEFGPAADVLDRPAHAYTRKLIAAVPRLERNPSVRTTGTRPVLTCTDVNKTFVTGRGFFGKSRVVPALRRVGLTLHQGETLGVVGESGSGKSTLARAVVRLIDIDAGSIMFGDTDFAGLKGRALRAARSRVQMVFQDPYASLNPREKVSTIITRGLRIQGLARRPARDKAAEMLALVGLDQSALDRFPHEFSGGQRQRIALARALVLDPAVLVADEPVSSLDVSIQAQVLELLDDIRRRLDLSMLFITHDLRIAAQVCDTVAVMKSGEVVEYGPTATIFANPAHAYTRQLMDAIPGRDWFQRSR